jgi:mannose-6-phosphate isomerase
MRIAIIAPRPPGAAAGLDAPETARCAASARALVSGLQARGHQVTVVELSDEDPHAELELAKLAARASDFDLLHTWAGYRSLLQLGSVATPLVASVGPRMVARAPEVFRHYEGRVHYVAAQPAVEGVRINSVLGWDRDEQAQQWGAALEELYGALVARAARVDRRPWGYYVVLADEPDHKVKRIVVYPGKRLSLQRHRKRSEHWFVLTGEAQVTRDEEELRIPAGHAVEIPVGAWHRIHNPSTADLSFIEVQTGEYFGEDDIERKEDDFGRI